MPTTKRELRLSPKFALPLELVTQRNAILAMSGAGKSNLAVVLAEEIHAAGVPWVAIDPKGDWWGIRSSSDGRGPGLDVPVLGGEHGDLPLSPQAGARVAELVAEGKFTGVLDTSEFETAGELSRFLTDFARTLLRRLRMPIHAFCEECDEYLPQIAGSRTDPQAAICVGAWKKLAKRGRFRGFGYTLISQRAAAVNKDALYQCETLFAMRVMGKRDREAVRGWVEQHEGAPELLKSLSSLEDGETWIWSPQRLKLMERVRVRRRRTFDSGRTPEIGEVLAVPKLAAVDLQIEMLRTELELEPNTDDTAQLRARIAELEREIERLRKNVNHPAWAAAARAAAPARAEYLRPEPKPAAARPTKARIPTVLCKEGWTVMEEEQYQKWKERLIAELREEAPALLKTLATRSELEVTIERKVIEIGAGTLRSRVAELVAKDFFNEAKTGNAAFVELKRLGVATAKPNVYRELDTLAAYGIVTKETDGYRIAPGAKVRLKHAS